jgi:cardiolipin synthase
MQNLNVPNILTVSRIAFIPVIVFLFLQRSDVGNMFVLLVFVFCCITDFLDGYFARANKQTTKLGQILDPVADKSLISTTMLLITKLCDVSVTTVILFCIILCRELLISDIRIIIFAEKRQFATSAQSKWKTAIQMIAITVILMANAARKQPQLLTLGEILLWVSTIVSVISGASYCIQYWRSIIHKL